MRLSRSHLQPCFPQHEIRYYDVEHGILLLAMFCVDNVDLTAILDQTLHCPKPSMRVDQYEASRPWNTVSFVAHGP